MNVDQDDEILTLLGEIRTEFDRHSEAFDRIDARLDRITRHLDVMLNDMRALTGWACGNSDGVRQ
jgi:hypothetical protein